MSIQSNFFKQFIKFPTKKPPVIASPLHQRITIPRIQQFCQKILKLKEQNSEIECITDYDHTLTKYKYHGLKCDSLFGMWTANKALPQKFRQQLLNNYLQYGPYETDGTITFPQKYELINQLYYVQTKLFQNHKITVEMANLTINQSNVVFRAYSNRLFEVLNQTKIPLYIISGGISDVIYTSIYDIFGKVFPNISIHSNQLMIYKIDQINGGQIKIQNNYNLEKINNKTLKLNQKQSKAQTEPQITQQGQKSSEQYLIKFKKPLVHSYNKFEIMKSCTTKKKNCILMGDLQSDIYMARGVNYQTILSVFYAKQGDTDQRAYAEDKFDLIIEGDGSHKIVVELLKIIKGKKNINWEYLSSVHRNLHQYLI